MDIVPMIWPSVDRGAIAHLLDEVGDEGRLNTVMDLGKRELAALYEACADNEPLTLADLVPEETPPMTEVVHEGKNSLTLFNRFQKRFCRAAAKADELYGYNEQTMKVLTGPGYFVAHARAEGGVLVDYRRLPDDRPRQWPPIISNHARLGRFVYAGMVDVLRRVSRGVSIGRAFRGDRPMDAWFVLVRRTTVEKSNAHGH
ncbi:MAG TPA: hypothetical protein VGL13_07480 [Polyangiaceae bacterium]|jgi:hypothetical protein